MVASTATGFHAKLSAEVAGMALVFARIAMSDPLRYSCYHIVEGLKEPLLKNTRHSCMLAEPTKSFRSLLAEPSECADYRVDCARVSRAITISASEGTWVAVTEFNVIYRSRDT